MRYIQLFFLLIVMLSCKHDNQIKKQTDSIEIPIYIDSADTVSMITEKVDSLLVLNDSIYNFLQLISDKSFEVDKNWDDKYVEKLIPLDQEQIEIFYATQELKEYHDFYNFHSFFYGKLKSINNLTPILILNTDWETSIYLDCFFVNSKGVVKDMFRPSYLELQPSYSHFGKGVFLSDTVYKLIATSYETIDFENNIEIMDSLRIIYSIDRFGKISEERTKYEVDTIYSSL